MAIFTLYMSITGGVDWWEVQRVMLRIGTPYGVLFALYVAIMFFALLNIVTGIFVNDAVEMTQRDRDVILRLENEKRREAIQSLKNIFAELDTGSGVLTLEDFSASLETPQMAALLSCLGLDVTDTVGLFEALDMDGSDGLDIKEFVKGCMQLRGQAKTVDMVTLMRENKRLMKKVTTSMSRNEAHLIDVRHHITLLSERQSTRADDITLQISPDGNKTPLRDFDVASETPRSPRIGKRIAL